MLIVSLILFVAGFILIIKGGDMFVDAAVYVARVTGIPKIIIGATIVSFATTLPEFFVSAVATAQGAVQMGVGNAAGSVICNTGLILALSLIARPGRLDKKMFLEKALLVAGALFYLWWVCADRILRVWESLPLLALLGVFFYLNVKGAKKAAAQERTERQPAVKNEVAAGIFKFVTGAAGIIAGANLLVDNGQTLAIALGVPSGVVGVTVIALGTSLPELATTLSAIRKKEAAMGIGNILGANLLNLAMILPACAMLAGGLRFSSEYLPQLNIIAPRTLIVDIPVLAAMFAILIVPPLLMRKRSCRLTRAQGIAMLALYVGFCAFVICNV